MQLISSLPKKELAKLQMSNEDLNKDKASAVRSWRNMPPIVELHSSSRLLLLLHIVSGATSSSLFPASAVSHSQQQQASLPDLLVLASDSDAYGTIVMASKCKHITRGTPCPSDRE
eukprot:scaffold28378_cov223-Skeletonema_marinoi.AAC.3